MRQKKTPFNMGSLKRKVTRKTIRPGPGQYTLKNEIQDYIIERTKKGYKGSFGSNELRFGIKIDEEDEDIPGPGSYDDKRIFNKLKQQKGKPSGAFKSQAKRELFIKKDQIPTVGIYEQHHGSIVDKLTR